MGGMAVGMKDECGETRQEAVRRGGGTAVIGQGRIRGRRYWRGPVRLHRQRLQYITLRPTASIIVANVDGSTLHPPLDDERAPPSRPRPAPQSPPEPGRRQAAAAAAWRTSERLPASSPASKISLRPSAAVATAVALAALARPFSLARQLRPRSVSTKAPFPRGSYRVLARQIFMHCLPRPLAPPHPQSRARRASRSQIR